MQSKQPLEIKPKAYEVQYERVESFHQCQISNYINSNKRTRQNVFPEYYIVTETTE